MNTKKDINIKSGLLTNPMDTDSKGFHNFKEYLDAKISNLSTEEKIEIELESLRIQMEDYLADKDAGRIISSGIFLKKILKNLGIKQTIFAEYIGIRPSNLSKLLNGERKISFEMSITLSNIFNLDPQIWIRIQAENQLRKLSKRELKKYSKFKIADLMKNMKRSNK